MIVRKTALAAGILALGLGAAGVANVSAHQQGANPTAPERRAVLVGLGDAASSANMFSPKYIDVYAGDTVTWRVSNPDDPHTVSFGPRALLEQLAKNLMVPAPQEGGPPLLAINPQAAKPTLRATYDGTGFANSGILAAKGQSWSLTFTKPGTYEYDCLLHKGMDGTITVLPRGRRG